MNQPAEVRETNFEFVETAKRQYDLTYKDLGRLTGYSKETVRAWFAPHNSTKFRAVPDRAVRLLRFELEGKRQRRA